MNVRTVEVEHLFVSPGHNYYGRHGKGSEDHEIVDCDEIELVAGRGIKGDRFFDYKEDYKGQITLFDGATYAAVKEEFQLPDLSPSAFRRNVIVSGADLNELIGKCFFLGDLELSGSEEAKPCYWMDEACAPGVEEFLKGQGGLRCRILRGGVLGKGTFTLTPQD
jgi:MOSC domain-containing protein YiiM